MVQINNTGLERQYYQCKYLLILVLINWIDFPVITWHMLINWGEGRREEGEIYFPGILEAKMTGSGYGLSNI